ncbi:MAG TPA: hypothetical protein VL970_10860 [Candidatus Acidoferrales bacterium]|nr:hypothetical protein [Candidatus Acidoferrales bacterium]
MEWAEKTLRANPEADLSAEAYAVCALAHERLGQAGAAKSDLAKAFNARDHLPKPTAGLIGSEWRDWIIAHALCAEAEGAIDKALANRPIP